jgi:fatty acid desaturase
MPSSTPRADIRVRAIPWRDLLELTEREKLWELMLPLPWLAGSLACYQFGHWILGAVCSFYFFLTGLRQSHGAQHYTLGISRVTQDGVLLALSVLMLGSMHAVQVSHLHHHRHCLDEDDTEGSTARLAWWRAILIGPLFPLRLHRTAWRLGSPAKRRWIAAETAAFLAVALLAIVIPGLPALRGHVLAMLVGESLTGFFAVWTVHHDCEPDGLFARTQRGRWVNRLCYGMFYHAEHHLFPAVPTCHLPVLAERLDAAMGGAGWKQVVGAPLGSPGVPVAELP